MTCTNLRRSYSAGEAIANFRKAAGCAFDETLCDLLASLMHWADAAGVDFNRSFERARAHYHAEVRA